jgi:xanthine dehydrogenase accessory factor
MYDEFFSKAHEFLSQGLPFAIAIVVRAEKPTSAKPGDKAIITPAGVMHGWIGGSCAQPTVIQEAMQALAEREPRFIRLTTDPQGQELRAGLLDLPMTCFSGGTLEIYIEPQLPLPRIMVIGNLPVAQALVQLGKAMNYQVIAVDPDNGGAGMTQADEIVTDVKQIPARITPFTYVVVASHGQYDELALAYALRSKAPYISLVASKKRAASVLAYLRGQGIGEAELARLKYPAGLDIQARRGDEIALSIMAEIVQQRRTAEPLALETLLEGIHLSGEPTEATDPVCGMTVQIAEAEYWTEYQGQTLYFCCESCKKSFENEPGKFLDRLAPSGQAVDPVCGMPVEIARAKYMSEHAGQLYYFCAAGCQAAFDREPSRYLALPAGK